MVCLHSQQDFITNSKHKSDRQWGKGWRQMHTLEKVLTYIQKKGIMWSTQHTLFVESRSKSSQSFSESNIEEIWGGLQRILRFYLKIGGDFRRFWYFI